MLLVTPVLELVTVFTFLFIGCEVPQRQRDKFDGIIRVIDQFEWYSFSDKMQKVLPLVIAYSQQPVEIKCFGGIPCNRETFKKVSRAVQIFINNKQD